MLNKLLFGLLLVISAAQALLLPEAISEKKELSCLEKIQWYRDVTNTTKKMYDDYLKHLEDAKVPTGVLDSQQIEDAVAVMLKKYDSESSDLSSIDNNATKERLCQVVIDSYKMLNANLTQSATNFKSEVLSNIEFSEQNSAKDDLNKTLSELVNFLYIIDLNKYPFTDVPKLVNKSTIFTNNGVELEKEWKLKSNGDVEISDDMDTITYDDNKDTIEEKKKRKAMDDEIQKNMDELEKPLTPVVYEGDDDQGTFGISAIISQSFGVTVSSIIVLAALVALILWIVHQTRSGSSRIYTTF